MGLSANSTGFSAAKGELVIKKKNENDRIIAIAGNPNVGKSTIFNALTGMHQHTGNWPGKTVSNAQGYLKTANASYVLVDIPGTYSLLAHSPEEEIARNFICFSKPEKVIVVCDGTCLERNLNLVLQTLEITENVIVCVNLLDEAKRKGIKIDLKALSESLGVRVVGTVGRDKKSLSKLCDTLDTDIKNENTIKIIYPNTIEKAISILEPTIKLKLNGKLDSRWFSIKLLENDITLINEAKKYIGDAFFESEELKNALSEAKEILESENIDQNKFKDMIVSSFISTSEKICKNVVKTKKSGYSQTDRKIDKVITSKRFGYPIMLLLLCFVFWLTIFGANYISEGLSFLFLKLEEFLQYCFIKLDLPDIVRDIIIEGFFRVPSWVISVMLPPMAIFFPLFTLLEDAGYLPRVAFNLDKPFKRCKSCGKQALTMCMGFGCNAAGVVGCRIIDSPRERLLAIITNSLVPCNGRFPAIIAIISMFFVTTQGFFSGIASAVILTAVILLGILMTFLTTKILSSTVLKGKPSSYTLEMPPYRRPQIIKVLVRSVFDRTLFVLGRALLAAIPAGLILWILANTHINDASLLIHISHFLDPFGKAIGLDGIILTAFILGLPANEIVLPIIIMGYLSNTSLTELPSILEMRGLLLQNGWTVLTAANTIIFSLFHWPCSTTLITIKKETKSFKWTFLSATVGTTIGIVLCLFTNLIYKLLI